MTPMLVDACLATLALLACWAAVEAAYALSGSFLIWRNLRHEALHMPLLGAVFAALNVCGTWLFDAAGIGYRGDQAVWLLTTLLVSGL
mgnify:FL=1